MRGTRYEISSSGFDQDLQNVGSDPSGGPYDVGLRVPSGVPLANISANRYLFMLAMARFNANQKARLVGMRQLVTIGQYVPSDPQDPEACQYPLQLQVTSPFWHFVDGNITWYIQRIPPIVIPNNAANNSDGVHFQYSTTPALLFETTSGGGGGDPDAAYTAPNGGRAYGTPLVANLSGFHDLRSNWTDGQNWNNSLDIEIEGPCDIAMFASVKQTNIETRCALVLPDDITSADLPPEDRFVFNFPDTQYWRIAGSLIFEEEQYYEEPNGLKENYHAHELSYKPGR